MIGLWRKTTTSVEQVWKSFEMAREKWEMKAMAAASRCESEQEERRVEQAKEEEEDGQEWERKVQKDWVGGSRDRKVRAKWVTGRTRGERE